MWNYPSSVNTCSWSDNLGPGGQHHLGPGGQHQQPHSVRLMRQEGQSCGVEQGSCMPGLQCVGNQVGGGVCMAPLGPGGQHRVGVVEGYHGKINLYVMNGCGWCKKLKQRIAESGKEHLFEIKDNSEAPKEAQGFPYLTGPTGKNHSGYMEDIDALVAKLM